MLVSIVIVFHIEDSEKNGYKQFFESADQATELLLEDIEDFKVANEDFDGAGRKWESGIKLPAPPIIVKTVSNVVIEGPAGVITVSAHTDDEPEQI